MNRGHCDDHDVDLAEVQLPDEDHDGDSDNKDDDDGKDHDGDYDDNEVDLVVLLRIGSSWMSTRMREREVEGTVGSFQTVHWS